MEWLYCAAKQSWFRFMSMLPEDYYSSQSELTRPKQFFHDLANGFLQGYELGWFLFTRSLAGRFRGSALHFLWAFIPSVTTAFLFIALRSHGLLRLGETSIPYPLYVISGLLFWQIFLECLYAPLKSLKSASAILAKIKFPWEALILFSLLSGLFQLIIEIPVFLVILIYFKISFHSGFFLLLLILPTMMLIGFTIGQFLAPLSIIYGDFRNLLSVLIPLWFFSTPIVYQASAGSLMEKVCAYNPISFLLENARDALFQGQPHHILIITTVFLSSLFLYLLSIIVSRLAMPIIIERMP